MLLPYLSPLLVCLECPSQLFLFTRSSVCRLGNLKNRDIVKTLCTQTMTHVVPCYTYTVPYRHMSLVLLTMARDIVLYQSANHPQVTYMYMLKLLMQERRDAFLTSRNCTIWVLKRRMVSFMAIFYEAHQNRRRVYGYHL